MSARGDDALRPTASAKKWVALCPFYDAQVVVGTVYRRGSLRVISALEIAEYPDGSGESGPQWHVSISRGGRRRASASDIARVLRGLGLKRVRVEEDNHHPGVARHFWLPVNPSRRVDCECKLTEDTIVEPDGYRWTNPVAGRGPCRGCEYARLIPGKQCPLHGSEAARTGA